MKLIFDEYYDCYIWVESEDEGQTMSPEFVSEHDAIVWYNHMKEHFYNKISKKQMATL